MIHDNTTYIDSNSIVSIKMLNCFLFHCMPIDPHECHTLGLFVNIR